MDGFLYRSKAHLIAIGDIVLSSLSFIWSLIFLLGAFALSEEPKTVLKPDEEPKKAASTFYVVWVWLNAICLFGVCIVDIVAAVKLLNATKLGIDPKKSLKWSRFWLIVNIVFLVELILNLLFCSSDRGLLGYAFILLNIGIRVTAVVFIQKFVEELRPALYDAQDKQSNQVME